jgi:CRP-like cAMP-binding protein
MCASACTAHRVFLQNMLKVIGDKYFHLFDRINVLSEKTLRARITAYLYALSDRGKKTVVTIPTSKTMLADYLLANRSALSKELRKMERDGLIVVKGREIELTFLA